MRPPPGMMRPPPGVPPHRSDRASRRGGSDAPIRPKKKRQEEADTDRLSEKRGRDLSTVGENALPAGESIPPQTEHDNAPGPRKRVTPSPHGGSAQQTEGTPRARSRRRAETSLEGGGRSLFFVFALAFVLVAVGCVLAWTLFLKEAEVEHEESLAQAEVLADDSGLRSRQVAAPRKTAPEEQLLLKHHRASGMNTHTAYRSRWKQDLAGEPEQTFLEDRMFMDSLRQVSLLGDEYTAMICTTDQLAKWSGVGGETGPAEHMSEEELMVKHVSDIHLYRPLITYRAQPDRFRVGEEVEVNGVLCQTVRYTPPSGPVVEMAFDPQSGLELRRTAYYSDDEGARVEWTDFRDYREIGGVPVAHQRIKYRDGQRVEQLTLESYEANPDFSLKHFMAGQAVDIAQ